jgi:hypothetical protein
MFCPTLFSYSHPASHPQHDLNMARATAAQSKGSSNRKRKSEEPATQYEEVRLRC